MQTLVRIALPKHPMKTNDRYTKLSEAWADYCNSLTLILRNARSKTITSSNDYKTFSCLKSSFIFAFAFVELTTIIRLNRYMRVLHIAQWQRCWLEHKNIIKVVGFTTILMNIVFVASHIRKFTSSKRIEIFLHWSITFLISPFIVFHGYYGTNHTSSYV